MIVNHLAYFQPSRKRPAEQLAASIRHGVASHIRGRARKIHFKTPSKDGRIQVGNKTFSKTTIANLKRKQLLRGEVPSLSPTLAGDLAIDRLKGPHS